MPAYKRRRKHKNSRLKSKLSKKKILFFTALIMLGVIIFSFFKITNTPNKWNEDEKLAVVIDNREEGVVVVLLDPMHNEIYKFYYPENLEIDAARNMGTWKIGSLWRLGIDEDVGGSLLAHTVTKSLKTPVYAWSGPELMALLDKGYFAIPEVVLSNNSHSNLSLGDKINISKFISGTDDSRIYTYLPEDMNYITKQTLKDGTDGYIVRRDPGVMISTLFSNEYIINQPNRTVIINSTNNNVRARQIGEVFEIIGLKIASIREETHEVTDCEISSTDEKIGNILSKYFGCDYNTKTSTGFDIEIRIGEDFIERF